MTDWNRYPETKPKEEYPESPVWYAVTLRNGDVQAACWWLNNWYCFSEPYNIIGWK